MKLSRIYPVALVILFWGLAQAQEHRHGAPAKVEKTAPLSDESIYNLHSLLFDENGKKVDLEKFRGQPVVISMAYTSCTYTCPMIIAQMQQIEKILAEKGKKDVRFVLVSFDPEKDKPSVLKAYAKKRGLSDKWSLLTSNADKAPREIAGVLGIKYARGEGGDYDHSFVITVLDSEGVPQGKQVGAAGDPKDLIKLIP